MANVRISELPALATVPSAALVPVVSAADTWQATVANLVKGGGAILKDGTVAFTAAQSMGGFKLTSLGAPVAVDDAATKAYVDASVGTLLDWKQSVRVASTANITLSGTQTIDGVSVIAGDRVLVKDHATGSSKGLYLCASGAWTRTTDADVSAEVTTGLTVFVEEGTANGGKLFMLTTTGAIVLGTTALTFTALSSIPTASAVGQTLVWNGSAYVSGALDLADVDARTGTLPAGNGGTGIAGAGGTANRALVTTDGSTWGAGFVALATMVSGLLPFANIADGAALSVLGRSANTSGVQASIAGTADQVLRVNGAGTVLGFGAIATAGITDGAVTLAKLANATAASVLGRSAASTGVYADIASAADGQVMRRSIGGALAFGNPDFQQLSLSAGLTTIQPPVLTSGQGFALVINAAAHTNQTASVELVDVEFNLARTVQFATGAKTTQRAALFRAPTYGFVGASTITDAATLAIIGAPTAGTNATITNAYALWVQSGNVRIQGMSTGIVRASATGIISAGAAVALTDMATQAAVSVVANATAATAAPTALAASAVGQVLGYQGTTLQWVTTIGDTATNVEVANLSSRAIVSLCLGADLTTTQMPALTGANVVFLANATIAPTTAFPVGGAIVYTDATQGFSVKDKLGGEVSFGTGESGNTVRRRLLEVRTPGTKVNTSATTQVTCGSFDCTALNNQSITNATLLVRYRVVAFSSGSYHSIAEKVACISTNGAGAPTLVGTVANGNSATGGIIGTDYSAVTIDVSGNTVRGRITPATTDNYDHFGFFEIMGASQ